MEGPKVTLAAATKKFTIDVCFADGTNGMDDLLHMEGLSVFGL